MTVGEGLLIGGGVVVLAFAAYTLVPMLKGDGEADRRALEAQLEAARLRQQLAQPRTGNDVADVALGFFNAVGGVPGLFDLADRLTD